VDETLTLEEAKLLIEHCRAGRLYEIERWIASGKSIQPPLPSRKLPKTPLQVAIQTGFHSLVELLVRNEASQEVKNRALSEAVSTKRLDLVQLLVEHGAAIRAVPLLDAVRTSKLEIMRYFLESGADAITDHPFENAFREEVWISWQAFTRYKKTHPELATELQKQADCALRYFASEGNLKWVRLLMVAGANPRSSGPVSSDDDDPECYTTALKEACKTGNLDLLKKLKPDPAKDNLTELLQGLFLSASTDVIRYLVKLGANPNDLPNGGSSILDLNLRHLDLHAQRDEMRRDLIPKYLIGHGLDCIQVLVECGALWRPEERHELSAIRRMLVKFDPEVTVTILKLFSRHRTASIETMERLLDSPQMKAHMSGLGIKL
jgi:hypothetical protein